DAHLERTRADDGQGTIAAFQLVLDVKTKLARKTAVVGEELLREVRGGAHPRKQVGVELDIAPRVREHQIVRAAQVLEQVPRDRTGGLVFLFLAGRFSFAGRLSEAVETEPDTASRLFRFHDVGRGTPAVKRAKKIGGEIHVAEGCAQPDAPHSPMQCALETMQEGLQLRSSFVADERMQLVDDDETESSKKA